MVDCKYICMEWIFFGLFIYIYILDRDIMASSIPGAIQGDHFPTRVPYNLPHLKHQTAAQQHNRRNSLWNPRRVHQNVWDLNGKKPSKFGDVLGPKDHRMFSYNSWSRIYSPRNINWAIQNIPVSPSHSSVLYELVETGSLVVGPSWCDHPGVWLNTNQKPRGNKSSWI